MQAVLSNFNMSKLSRLLPWLGLVVLLVGIGVYVHNRGNHIATQRSAADQKAAASYKPGADPKAIPLERAARIAAGRFVIDAVQRKNLAEAWKLASPEMRAGFTRKQWMTGNIPVVPFPAALASAPLKVDYSLPNKALLEVALVPKNPKKITGGVFWLTMKTIGTGDARKWVVVSWVPRYAPPIPALPGS